MRPAADTARARLLRDFRASCPILRGEARLLLARLRAVSEPAVQDDLDRFAPADSSAASGLLSSHPRRLFVKGFDERSRHLE